MDRDTVIALAREAGVQPIQEFALMGAWVTNTDAIQRFAALVAAHEREECAKVADIVAREIDDTNGTATYIAAAIRSRT